MKPSSALATLLSCGRAAGAQVGCGLSGPSPERAVPQRRMAGAADRGQPRDRLGQALEKSVMSQPRPRLDILIIENLTEADLPAIAWSGGPGHLKSVAGYLARAASGDVEYLAVRAPDGRIVAKGGIDYAEHPGYGTMLQLAANPTGRGYGTLLIQAMEERIRARGVDAMLGVEPNNPGALRLYRRLGYTECGTEDASWETTDARGRRFMYRTTLTLLQMRLS